MRRAVAAMQLVWALINVVVAYFFVTNAFVAKTAIKEGLPAQAALLLGGALIGALAIALGREALKAFRAGGTAEA